MCSMSSFHVMTLLVCLWDIRSQSVLKSVLLTPSNPSQDGATVTDTSAGEITANTGWDINVVGDSTWHLLTTLDTSWGFHPTEESIITFEIESPSIRATTFDDLILAFTTPNVDEYIAMNIRMGESIGSTYDRNRIVPYVGPTYCPQSGSNAFASGNVVTLLQESGRRDKNVGLYSGTLSDELQTVQSGLETFPIKFTLINKPDALGNSVEFFFESVDGGLIEKCVYKAFDTNQGLLIYFAVELEGDSFTVNSFKVTYSAPADDSGTQQPTTTSSDTTTASTETTTTERITSNPFQTSIAALDNVQASTSLLISSSKSNNSVLSVFQSDNEQYSQNNDAFVTVMVTLSSIVAVFIGIFGALIAYKLIAKHVHKLQMIIDTFNTSIRGVTPGITPGVTPGVTSNVISTDDMVVVDVNVDAEHAYDVPVQCTQSDCDIANNIDIKTNAEGVNVGFETIAMTETKGNPHLRNDEFIIDGDDMSVDDMIIDGLGMEGGYQWGSAIQNTDDTELMGTVGEENGEIQGSEYGTSSQKKQELEAWFRDTVELPYYNVFVMNGFEELSTVAMVNMDILKTMGIDKIGHRIKLMQCVEALKKIN